jgi:hypothetical protein
MRGDGWNPAKPFPNLIIAQASGREGQARVSAERCLRAASAASTSMAADSGHCDQAIRSIVITDSGDPDHAACPA